MAATSKEIAEDAPTMNDAVKKADSMREQGLAELFLHGLKDIYYAEKKLTKAIPKMIKASQSGELSAALNGHLEETTEHVTKVERVFALLDMTAKSTKCDAIDGILAEGDKILAEFGKSKACDAAIIFAAQAVEHYEITRYGSLHAFALMLGYDEAAEILQGILDEEKNADAKLNDLAEEKIDFQAVNHEHIAAEAHRSVAH